MSDDRFYVRESTGYRGTSYGHVVGRRPTQVMIIDSLYCHRVIWSRWSGGPPEGGHAVPLERLRPVARKLCAQMNEEDRLEMAAA